MSKKGMKFSSVKRDGRCRLCKHPNLKEVHTLWLSKEITKTELAKKYLPEMSLHSAFRSLRTHFNEHLNLERVVNEVVIEAEKAISSAINEAAPSTAVVNYNAFPDKGVFTKIAADRISSQMTIEVLIRNLMEKVNVIEEEWQAATEIDKCSTCKRSNNGPALVKQLACIKELRELNKELQAHKDPVGLFRQFWGSTFVTFVDDLTKAYSDVIRERNNLLRDAVHAFIRGDIGQPTVLRRLQDSEDMCAPLLAEKSNLIAQEAMKNFSRAIDAMAPANKRSATPKVLTPVKTVDED